MNWMKAKLVLCVQIVWWCALERVSIEVEVLYERGQRNVHFSSGHSTFAIVFISSMPLCHRLYNNMRAREHRVGTANGCRERVIERARNSYKKLIRAFHSPFARSAIFFLFFLFLLMLLRSPLVNVVSVCANRVVHYLPLHYIASRRSDREEKEKIRNNNIILAKSNKLKPNAEVRRIQWYRNIAGAVVVVVVTAAAAAAAATPITMHPSHAVRLHTHTLTCRDMACFLTRQLAHAMPFLSFLIAAGTAALTAHTAALTHTKLCNFLQ